jgi:hypothetical protein
MPVSFAEMGGQRDFFVITNPYSSLGGVRVSARNRIRLHL